MTKTTEKAISAASTEHVVTIETLKRSGIDDEHTPVCSCGWKGITEVSHNDWCWSNLRDQEKEHLRSHSNRANQGERK